MEILVAAKEAVEANWKNSLWTLVSTKMEELGARKYPSDFLHKEFKKMEEMGARKYPSNFLHKEFKKMEAAGTTAGALQDDRYSKMKRRLTRSAA